MLAVDNFPPSNACTHPATVECCMTQSHNAFYLCMTLLSISAVENGVLLLLVVLQ